VENTFTLKNGSMAVLASINQSSVVRIPANAQVVLVEGNVERDRFIRIRYEGNLLLMLSEDLRRGIGSVRGLDYRGVDEPESTLSTK
jgi:hypothetical protein